MFPVKNSVKLRTFKYWKWRCEITTGVYQRSYQSPEIPIKGKYGRMSWRRQTSDKNGEFLITLWKAQDVIWAVVCACVYSWSGAEWAQCLQSHFHVRNVLLAHGCALGVWVQLAYSKVYKILCSKYFRNERNFECLLTELLFTVKIPGLFKKYVCLIYR